ncbi:acyltransferase [Shewanella scandinavica]|uniref:acyltransferase n=1 Tax=Shewanella scandinavica TaxID=3063538 RepID=UPI00319C42AF
MERDERIDLLRFIGLAMVIFAHVNPPDLLFQLRDFDVPLMVLVSALSFGLSYSLQQSYKSYLWKRIKRLVFPVWIFLSIYFSAEYLVFPESLELNSQIILSSYTLASGIGYVWIIRVFLLVAFFSPFIFRMHINTDSNLRYFGVWSLVILTYEVLRCFLLPTLSGLIGDVIVYTVFYAIPFCFIFAVGLRMLEMTPSGVKNLALTCVIVLILSEVVLYIFTGSFQYTFNYKYPPSVFYIAYSFVVSCVLWLNASRLLAVVSKLRFKKIFTFISNNTIWIYLWHIPFVKVLGFHFAIKYLVVFCVASFVCLIQVSIVRFILDNYIKNPRVSRNLKVLFTG